MKKKILYIVIALIIIIFAVFWFFDPKSIIYPKADWKVDDNEAFSTDTVAYEQFGFLIGPSADEIKLAREIGASWIRPHPGPFVWGKMQKNSTSEFDFSTSDEMVKASCNI